LEGEQIKNKVRLTGGVTDENLLKLLEYCEGFHILVHSIGISLRSVQDPAGNINFVLQNRGINHSGTPSELGMIRYDRDVLRDRVVQPDIVVVEFAVNDEGDETKGTCNVSLVLSVKDTVVEQFGLTKAAGNLISVPWRDLQRA
jgi:hypothetical protein